MVVGTFNQEKALVGAFSVIVKTGCGTDGSICGTNQHHMEHVWETSAGRTVSNGRRLMTVISIAEEIMFDDFEA